MKNIFIILIISCISCIAHAVPTLQPNSESVLRVGIVPFTEPFIMQASSTEYYGFDISTMNSVCQHMKRTCSYIPIRRSEILKSFDNNQIGVAVGDFVINAKMQKYVNFSIPYMTSQAQFVGLEANQNNVPNLDTIQQMRVGVITNSAYAIALTDMNIQNSNVKTFETDNDIISAIKSNQIDVGFINSYIANYWEHNSGGIIHPIGAPISIGFGLGLVINPSQLNLLIQLNLAIYNYQNSTDFKYNYNMFLSNL